MPEARMIRSPKASTNRPLPSADTKRISANAEITAPAAVLPTPNERANSGLAGATTPNPTATATDTAVRTATSRGRSRNGLLTSRSVRQDPGGVGAVPYGDRDGAGGYADGQHGRQALARG